MPYKISKRFLSPFLLAIGIWALIRVHLCASLASEHLKDRFYLDPLIREWWLWSIVAAASLTIAIVGGRDKRGPEDPTSVT